MLSRGGEREGNRKKEVVVRLDLLGEHYGGIKTRFDVLY